MQLIAQDHRISNSQTFNTFLLTAQKETRREAMEKVNLNVFLMNEHKLTVTVLSTEQTDVVLDNVCSQLNIPEDLVTCFSLFLIRRDEDGDITVLRKLQDFESPYISHKAVSATSSEDIKGQGPVKIMLRKSSWDASIDDVLLSEQATLNLLYIQTVADLERGWIVTSEETKQQLALMQARGSKRQYMEVARTLKFYGFMVFRSCVSDHPEPHTRVTVTIGKSSLNMRIVPASPDGETHETSFKITRMRCWRIMKGEATDQVGMMRPEGSKLELSFEYLVTPERLEWVRLVSGQAILMSMCLQSMVEELVRIRSGEKDPGSITRCSVKKPRSRTSPPRSDQSPDAEDGCGGGAVDYTVRRLAERFTSVNMKTASKAAEDVFEMENEMFSVTGLTEETESGESK